MNELGLLFFSLLCIILVGAASYPDGMVFRGVHIPGWCEALAAFLALIPAFLTLKAIIRAKGKAKKVEYTDQDVAKAKAEMDRMYFKKYGKLPEYPPATQKDAQGPEAGATGPEHKP